VELAKVITPENRTEVLPRFFHTSKKEAKEVSAAIRPLEAAPHRLVVTAARPEPAPRAVTVPAEVEVAGGLFAAAAPRVRPAEPHGAELPMAAPPKPMPAKAEPLTADLRRLHMTVSKRFIEKLEAAKDALSHSHPGAEVEAILEAGLDLVIERAAKRRGCARPKACTRPEAESHSRSVKAEKKPPAVGRSREGVSNSRHIPAAVKREVWIRDGGRCQFQLESGERCGSTHRVQFDHVRPVALGGESTVGNLRLACAAHNVLAPSPVLEPPSRYVRGTAPGRRAGGPNPSAGSAAG
jgi:5-methylcytosine-specific restriction endonuclease McrA